MSNESDMSEIVKQTVADFFFDKQEKQYQKGEIIAYAGEPLKQVTYLLDGVIEQYDITPEGNKIVVNMFKPFAFFPMSWAINRTPNNYFYAALSDVRVKHADPDEVVAFLQENPNVTFDLLSRVYRGTDALLQRLVVASSGFASSRLMFELLIEAYRFGGKETPDGLLLSVQQSSLASRSGLARETVSRELHKLEKEGLLKIGKSGIRIDIKKIEAALD